MTDLLVTKRLFNSPTGADGTNTLMPPLPTGDAYEYP
jgi:hypothetical protein